jgi:hypothetical protein
MLRRAVVDRAVRKWPEPSQRSRQAVGHIGFPRRIRFPVVIGVTPKDYVIRSAGNFQDSWVHCDIADIVAVVKVSIFVYGYPDACHCIALETPKAKNNAKGIRSSNAPPITKKVVFERN